MRRTLIGTLVAAGAVAVGSLAVAPPTALADDAALKAAFDRGHDRVERAYQRFARRAERLGEPRSRAQARRQLRKLASWTKGPRGAFVRARKAIAQATPSSKMGRRAKGDLLRWARRGAQSESQAAKAFRRWAAGQLKRGNRVMKHARQLWQEHRRAGRKGERRLEWALANSRAPAPDPEPAPRPEPSSPCAIPFVCP